MLQKKYNYLKYFVLLVIAVAYVLVFSYSTSPLYPNYFGLDFGGDSAQFLTVGKAWAQGRLPYQSMFDHKGPLIFFVDMVGYRLTGERFGILPFQIAAIFFTCLGIFKISCLANQNPAYNLVSVIASLSLLRVVYFNGNTVEEYGLPFFCFSVYFQVSWLSDSDDNKTHAPWQAFFYGLTFAVGLLTRLTNALPVCVGVLVITGVLLYHRQFKNLAQNIAGFLLGFLVLFLPFFLYFAIQGAAMDFWVGTLLYNMEYSAGMESWLRSATLQDLFTFFQCYLPWFMIGVSILLAFRRKKHLLALLYLLWFGSEFYLFCSGALFGQYAIIILAQAVLFFNEVMILGKTKPARGVQAAVLLFMIVFCGWEGKEALSLVSGMYHAYQVPQQKPYQALIDQIPAEDLDSFVAYGDNSLKDIYLAENLLPCYKYFTIQEWHASFSPEIRRDIHDTYAQATAKWILTCGDPSNIQDVLDSHYTEVSSTEGYTLWRNNA